MSTLPLIKHPILYFRSKWYHHKCKYKEAPDGTVVKEIKGVKFPFDLTLGKMAKVMYFGCYEFRVIRMMKKHLKTGSVFIDVGANVGYISAIGAAQVVNPQEFALRKRTVKKCNRLIYKVMSSHLRWFRVYLLMIRWTDRNCSLIEKYTLSQRTRKMC